MDAGPPDAGPPDAGPADTGPTVDGAVATSCNPTTGIQCDGDWEGRCAPACAAGECCSPIGGRFQCSARDSSGACPAPDLWVDGSRIEGDYDVVYRNFPDTDCAIAEGCVDGSGWRRLLSFGTWTPNTGTADLFLGSPSMEPTHFEYSECHGHHHFNSYARYFLRSAADGSVAAQGHKQAFCLLDFYQYPGTDGRGSVYTCGYQGIQMGWQDVYGRGLDCQWVDVTGVPAGDYELQIDVNFDGVVYEQNYTNNTVTVPVTIPPEEDPVDVTLPCPGGTPDGTSRNCGFTRAGSYTCTPGGMVTVACSATCGLGDCSGDPFMRVCDTTADPTCMGRLAIGQNDDSGCGSGTCGRGGDCCSQASFTCPASGGYVVFYAPYRIAGAATCNVASSP
jgi:hypothetical protein